MSNSSLPTLSPSTLPEQTEVGGGGRPRLLPIATALCAAATFAADTFTPTDIAFAALYSAVVLMAARFCSARGTIGVAVGCVALTMLSFYLTPPGGPEFEGIANTGISLAAIGLTTLLVVQQKAAEASMREQANEIRKLQASEIRELNKQLAKRAREILLGVPGLLHLHASESLWRRRSPASAGD